MHPSAYLTILTMINAVQKDRAQSDTNSPILAHCAAGVGRTGVFITFYHMQQRIENGDRIASLFEFVAKLRWQRPEMVYVLPQYEFCSKGINLISN